MLPKDVSTLPTDTAPVRLGAIDFINTLPIYGPLNVTSEAVSKVSLTYGTPAALNELIHSHQLDISPVSSAYYLRHQNDLVLLDNLSVSSGGAVESVLFLSPHDLDQTTPTLPANEPIYVPDSSETSIALLANWLGPDAIQRFVRYPSNTVHTLIEARRNCLVIGDLALVAAHANRQTSSNPMQIFDLSRLWNEQTQLPFVFAVWVARRSWANKNQDALFAINQWLVEAYQSFLTQTEMRQRVFQKAHEHLSQMDKALPHQTVVRYLTQCLYYSLGPKEYKALQRFANCLAVLQMNTNVPVV